MRSLEGFCVGVTADRRADEQAELLKRRGATVLHGPTISTEYLGSDAALRAATETIIATPPAFLVATTGIGMRAWFEAAQTWGLAAALEHALRDTAIVARGPKAVAAVGAAGLGVATTAASERLDELLELLLARELSGAVVAFQHYGEENADAVATLAAAGAHVIDVPVYRWRMPDDGAAADRLIDGVLAGDVDAVTFTSAPAVTNLLYLARARDLEAEVLAAFNRGDVVAACIGPVCAASATRGGIEAPIAPSRGRLGLLVRALDDAMRDRRVTLGSGDVSVVMQGRVVAVDGAVVELTRRERDLLAALNKRAGTVVSKATLLRDVWDDKADAHAVEATVGRIRRRLGPAAPLVQVVRGRGYLIDAAKAV